MLRKSRHGAMIFVKDLLQVALWLCIIDGSLAVVVPSSGQIEVPTPSPSNITNLGLTTLALSNATSDSNPTSPLTGELNQGAPHCDINRYGPLDRDSCQDTIDHMKRSLPTLRRFVWADRSYSGEYVDIQIPYRFSSCKLQRNEPNIIPIRELDRT